MPPTLQPPQFGLGPIAARFPRSLLSFVVVGTAGLACDLTLLMAGEAMGLSLAAARAISVPVATCVTFTLNRRHTFCASGLPLHHEAARYALVTLVAQSINYAGALILIAASPSLPHGVAAAMAAAIASIFSYAGQRLVTFRGLDAAASL